MDNPEEEDFNLDAAKALHEVSVPLTVGRATVSWNTLSGTVYLLFKELSGLGDNAAKATFFCVTSDRSQRDMVGALVQTRLESRNPKLAKRILKLLAKANAIAGKRNDILHVVYREPQSPSKVHQLHERGHLKGKSGDELLRSIHQFGMDTLDLAIEIMDCVPDLLDELHSRPQDNLTKLVLGNALQWPQGSTSQGVFGLLDVPANTELSPPEDPEAEQTQK